MEQSYCAEYARSGRSSCKLKSCKQAIPKDELRIGHMSQSAQFDGIQTHWYHYDCFFSNKRFLVRSSGEVKGFELLRFEDQKRLEKSMKSDSVAGPSNSGGDTGKKTNRKRKSDALENVAASVDPALNEFEVEYAKSNRSMCKVCENVIDKGAIRIGKRDRESDHAKRYGPLFRWFHVDCFASNREKLDFFWEASQLPQFGTLEKADKKALLKKLPTSANAKKPKIISAPKVEVDQATEAKLKKQSDVLYKYTEMLKALKRKDLLALIAHNNVCYNSDSQHNLNYLSDALAFGIPEDCPKCGGALCFKVTTYRCNGVTEWGAQCDYKTDQPSRRPIHIPEELKATQLGSYKYKPANRVYNQQYKAEMERRELESIAQILNVKKDDGGQNGEEASGSKPLSDYNVGLLVANKALGDKIRNLGADIPKNKINNLLCYVCETSKFKRAKTNQKFEHARDQSIPIVSEQFVAHLQDADPDLLSSMLRSKLEFWELEDEDIGRKVDDCNIKTKLKGIFKSGSKSGTSSSGTNKVICKSGAAVDPASKLQDAAHILKVGQTIYNTVLNNVNVSDNKNSFYKIQILEDDAGKGKYWLFKSWGRIGTEIGGSNCKPMKSKFDAIEQFEDSYYQLTENEWSNRANFQKVPLKYYEVDIDYGECNEEALDVESSKSTLPDPIKRLISRIFDVKLMKKAMMEFELDLDKMPLGKLSHAQLLNACSVLQNISNLLEASPIDVNQLQAACNHFYTLVPHNFGLASPPIINSQEQVAKKNEMLDALMKMEVAYSIINTGNSDTSHDPIDVHYQKLSNEITVLDEKSEEFKLIKKYIKLTHAKTHSHYTIELVNVFKLDRKGEDERFAKYNDAQRMLLWHGSRTTNFAGILSQGLRIAPPEAPVSGYMFGKGVYFADSVSKSANYCNVSQSDPRGLLMLTEVALGESLPLKHAQYITKLDKKYMSVLGMGQSVPNPDQLVTLPGGLKVPCGRLLTKRNGQPGDLLYNEYIIYNEDQARQRYLVDVVFHFKAMPDIW